MQQAVFGRTIHVPGPLPDKIGFRPLNSVSIPSKSRLHFYFYLIRMRGLSALRGSSEWLVCSWPVKCGLRLYDRIYPYK